MSWQLMAAQAGGQLLGSVFGESAETKRRKALEDQKKLMQEQYGYNSQLMNESYDLQQRMYDHTYDKNTPEVQMANLKKAGLNPALMYGSGTGQGGATTGGGSASVSGGSASGAAEMIGAETQQKAQLMQTAMTASQIKLNEATAEKTEAEAAKISGVDTQVASAGLQKIIAETTNETTKNQLMEIEKSIQLLSGTDQVDNIAQQNKVLREQVYELSRNNEIGDATKENIIKQVETETIGKLLENSLKRSGIEINMQKANEISQSIKQEWTKILQGWENIGISKEKLKQDWKSLDQKDQEIILKRIDTIVKAQYQGIQQVAGRVLNEQVVGNLYNLEQDFHRMFGNKRSTWNDYDKNGYKIWK